MEPIFFTDVPARFANDIMAQGVRLGGRVEICRTMRVTAERFTQIRQCRIQPQSFLDVGVDPDSEWKHRFPFGRRKNRDWLIQQGVYRLGRVKRVPIDLDRTAGRFP